MSFPAAKIIISDADYVRDEKLSNVLFPFRFARIITINGEIWDRPFWGLQLTMEQVLENWNLAAENAKWQKFDPRGTQKEESK